MKLSNQQLLNMVPILSRLYNSDFPVKTSYVINCNAKIIQKKLDIFQEEKSKLISKYGVKDENDVVKVDDKGSVTIAPEYSVLWNEDYNELLNITSDIKIQKIKIDTLVDSGLTLKPSEIELIDCML